MMAVSQVAAPKLMDALLAKLRIPAQRTAERTPNGMTGALDAPRVTEDRTEGDFTAKARRFSLYTWLETHPRAKVAATSGMLASAALLLRSARRSPSVMAMRDRT